MRFFAKCQRKKRFSFECFWLYWWQLDIISVNFLHMSVEHISFDIEAKNRISEEEQKLEIARQLEFSHEKQRLLQRIEKDKKLAHLKSLVERGVIRSDIIERIIAGEALDGKDVREIFEKIDEIEQVTNIDEILPSSLRITKEEYLLALDDDAARRQSLQKLDQSLDHLYHSAHPYVSGITSLFSSVFDFLSKNGKTVMKIQGNVIDVKRSIQSR